MKSREKNKVSFPQDFGGRLRQAIKGKGLKQKEFARLLGTTAVSMSRYVRNLQMPRTPVLAQMAMLLDVPKTWLQFGDRLGMDRPLAGVAEGAGQGYDDGLPGDMREAWRDLDAEERAALQQCAEILRRGDMETLQLVKSQMKLLTRAMPKKTAGRMAPKQQASGN